MSEKISKEEFLSRFYLRYPQAEIEVIKYSAISKPATIKCLNCGRAVTKKSARRLLDKFDCCGGSAKKEVGSDKNKSCLPPKDVQAQFDTIFADKIRIIEYRGFDKTGYYKCTECGKVFTKNFSHMLESKGCPVCKQRTSFEYPILT